MRKLLVGIAFAAAALMALAATGASAKAATSTAARCVDGVSDRIGGRTVCIHPGGKCVAAHNRKYRASFFTCVKGRLRDYAPAGSQKPPPPPPPPPPAPAATPGHYEGRTSQNEIIRLDVQPGGLSIRGLFVHAINESCNPSGGVWGSFTGTSLFPVTTDGTLAIDTPTVYTDGGTTKGRFTLRAGFSGIVVTGTLTDTTNLSSKGTAISCSSGLVTFTATRQP
jgi:hypothetical protein